MLQPVLMTDGWFQGTFQPTLRRSRSSTGSMPLPLHLCAASASGSTGRGAGGGGGGAAGTASSVSASSSKRSLSRLDSLSDLSHIDYDLDPDSLDRNRCHRP